MNIKLEQYKIFAEAATTLSFSLAARNLFVSQSAISQAINSLEKELNTQLFIRNSKGVSLTREGKILANKINQALSLISSVENEIVSYQNLTQGELIIGAGDTFSENYLLPYLKKFQTLYPKIKIKIINRTSLETIDLIKSGQIDLGFLNLPIQDSSLEINHLLTIHDIFISSKPINKMYTLNQLKNENLILLEKNSNSRKYLDYICLKEKVILDPLIELGAHELLLKSVQSDLGIACVVKEFSLQELKNKQVYELKLNKPIPQRSIGYAYLKRKTLAPATTKFIEILKEEII